MKTVEKHHGKSKTRAKANQTHLLDAEGLSSRVAVNKESIQYEIMTRVISSMKKLTRTQTIDITLFLWTHEVTAII